MMDPNRNPAVWRARWMGVIAAALYIGTLYMTGAATPWRLATALFVGVVVVNLALIGRRQSGSLPQARREELIPLEEEKPSSVPPDVRALP